MIFFGGGGGYLVKDNALHLKAALEEYTVTIDWEEKLYIRIALKWDYEKVTFQLSMPDYVLAVLQSFQHNNKKYPKTHHSSGHNPSMEKMIRYYQKRHQLKN